MKSCPKCLRSYADNTLNFCLDDGEWLSPGSESDLPTAILSEAPTLNDAAQASRDEAAKPTAWSIDFNRTRILGVMGCSLLAIIGIGAAWWYLGPNRASTGTDKITSLAVLPFENGSGDASMDFLSDGLSETLIDKLSEVPELKVIARTSSFKYRAANPDIQDIASKLGVQAIMTGKVAKVGDQLSVRVELVDASDNRQLWGDQFSRPQANVITIPKEIAQTVSEKLQFRLTGARQTQFSKTGTENPQAYEFYLKSKVPVGRVEGTKQAAQLLQQAVEADPRYALAWAELSLRYTTLVAIGVMDPKEGDPKTAASLQKALDLDPNLPEVRFAQATAHMKSWAWPAAEAEFKRTLDLNPGLSRARTLYSELLSAMGRHEEALAESAKGLVIDPISPAARLGYALRLHFARRHDESIAQLQKALELRPNFDTAYHVLGYNCAAKGMFREALDAYIKAEELGDTSPSNRIYLGAAYAKLGDRAKALDILRELQSGKGHAAPGELPALLIALGDHDAAIASFEKAYAQRDAQIRYWKIDPAFDPIRSDPRFIDLLRRVGLA